MTILLRSTAASDLIIGVAQSQITTAQITAGERVEIQLVGTTTVACGDTVTRGYEVTTDNTSRCVHASSGNRTIGIAMKSGVVGQEIPVLLRQGTMA